ncbi:hypothetical protein [Phocaeicola vulgatus]|uniref:hypothetical protein n=1 Tax=Phocaeicola vulgatus TaxID=821 RepID=UPI0030CA19B5
MGNGEMFRQPYTQIVSMAMNGVSEGESHSNPHINETCAYNLLKLTKDLNCFNPTMPVTWIITNGHFTTK